MKIIVICLIALVGLIIGIINGPKEKAEAQREEQRLESIRSDKSNYNEKTLRWVEAYGFSSSMDKHNPCLIKVYNVHIVDFSSNLISDGTNGDAVSFVCDNNIMNELRELYSRWAHFNAYCQVTYGVLDILMLEY